MKTTLTTLILFLAVVLQARGESLPREASVAVNTVTAAVPAPKIAPVAKPWPQESSDVKVDPHVVWGKLDNGLRYAIMPTDAPGRASLQLYMNVGSRMEADDQRGMAHYLEHMAFNGTKHFAAGEMVEYFQRLGMAFGAHTNANTTFERTVYELELPRTNEEMTGEALKLFRDFLDGMLLDETQVNRERRVILSEILARNDAASRSFVPAVEFALPETLIPRRDVLGTVETIRALPRKRFVDFYETWYTPARATVVAVGKFDVPMVERLIRRSFQDAKARRGEQPDPSIGKVTTGRGTIAGFHSDRDADSVSIDLSMVAPDSGRDSIAVRNHDVVLAIANSILSKRLVKLTTAKNAPIQSGDANFMRGFNLFATSVVSVKCQPAQWKSALAAAEQELRRALKFGFTDDEFVEIKSGSLVGLQAIVDQADNRQPAPLASEIGESLVEDKVFTSPQEAAAIVKRLFADLKKSDCEAALRQAWQSPDLQIWVDGNLQIDGDKSAQILAAYRASQSVTVQPPVDEKVGAWVYTDFGPAGQIVKRETQKDLDFVQAVFANNVRVNVKRTAYEKNAVRMQIRFGGGLLELPATQPGLAMFANSTFMTGGLKAHSFSDLKRIIADKLVGVNFAVSDDAFQLYGDCSPSMLDMELQLCAAELTAPGFRQEARDDYLSALPGFYAQFEHTPEGVLTKDFLPFVRSGDFRFGVAPRAGAENLTMDDLKTWLSEPLRRGYMEVAIVGDIDPDAALAAVAKTLGALPTRAAEKPRFAKERQIRFPDSPKTKEFHFVAETQRALSFVCWPTDGARNVGRDLRTGILARVLYDRVRLKIRQELGATYSPHVDSVAPDAYPDYGLVIAEMTVEPKQAAEIGPLVAKMGADLAAGEISDDEFQRAIKPVLSSLDDMVQNNGYWLYLLGRCQEFPNSLDGARTQKAEYASITKQEIQSLAKRYLAAGKATVIGVVPASTER